MMKKLGLSTIILLALTSVSFGQLTANEEFFLGEWEGKIWDNAQKDKTEKATLKFENKGGKLSAEWFNGFEGKATIFSKMNINSLSDGLSISMSDLAQQGKTLNARTHLRNLYGSFETKSGKVAKQFSWEVTRKGFSSSLSANENYGQGETYLSNAEFLLKNSAGVNSTNATERLKDVQRNLTEAHKKYSTAIETDKNFAAAFAKRGQVTRMMNPTNAIELKKALADFDTAISLYPKLNNSYYERALVKIALLRITRTGDFDSIIADLTEEIKLKPLVIALLARASAYYQKGSYELAKKDIDAILKDFPNNQDALQAKKMIDAKIGVKP